MTEWINQSFVNDLMNRPFFDPLSHHAFFGINDIVFLGLIAISIIKYVINDFLAWLRPRIDKYAKVRPSYRPPPDRTSLSLSNKDRQQYGKLLQSVQAAWSNRDLTALERLASPDMVRQFEARLMHMDTTAHRNQISDVQLLQCDVEEAWSEHMRDYAIVSLRYSMREAIYNDRAQVAGDSSMATVTGTETWTFIRPKGAPASQWIVLAIQQAS